VSSPLLPTTPRPNCSRARLTGMSTSGPGNDGSDQYSQQQLVDLLNRIQVENYCIVASSALLFVDAAITLRIEVQRIWKRKLSGATLVYFLTRYVAIAERITLLVSLFYQAPFNEDKKCAPVLRTDDTLTDLNYAAIGAFTALRLFGIYGLAWMPMIFIALLWIARLTIAVYLQVTYIPTSFGPPLWGCGAVFTPSPDTVYRLDTTANVLMLASDVVLVVLTWIKTFEIRKSSSRFGFKTPLATLLLRDGTVYFLVILVIQIFAIVSSQIGSGFILFDVWTYFAQVLTVISLYRFMLNLRGVYVSQGLGAVHGDPTTTSVTTTQAATLTQFSDPHFASNIVGNLGAPLHAGESPSTIKGGGEMDEGFEYTEWDVEGEDGEGDEEVSDNPLGFGLSGGGQGEEVMNEKK